MNTLNISYDEFISKLGSHDMLRVIMTEILYNSFEDFLNFIRFNEVNKKIYISINGTSEEKGYINSYNNKIWYDQWIIINRKNKYIKYNSEISYYSKFINEWKKVGKDPYINISKDCLDKNSKRGHLGNVKFLINKGIRPNQITLNNTVWCGNKELVEFIINKGIRPNKITLDDAARSGNQELVEFLINKGIEPDQWTLNYALWSGNQELIEFIINKGIQPNQGTLNEAALSGKQELFEFIENLL